VLPRASYGPWGWIMAVRQDWLDNLGITKAPETLDEFFDMAKRFTNDDPDQNGAKDTYGVTLFGGDKANVYFTPYGLVRNTFTVRDEKVVFTSVLDEYKEVLKILRSWYDAGVVDPEFVTDSRENARGKWAEGKLGTYTTDVWWWRSNVAENVQSMLLDKDPNAEILFIEPLKGPAGAFQTGNPPDFYSNAIAFGADTSDAKVERIMRMRNAASESQQTDGEFFNRVYYGVKDVDYTVNEDGTFTRVDSWPELTRKGIACFFSLQTINKEMYYEKDVPDGDRYYFDIYDRYPKLIQGTYGTDLPTMKQSPTWNERGAEIMTICNEFYLNAITGSVDIDAGWDAYIKALDDAGLQTVIEEYQGFID